MTILDIMREHREEGKDIVKMIKSSRSNPDPPDVRALAMLIIFVGMADAEDAAQVAVEDIRTTSYTRCNQTTERQGLTSGFPILTIRFGPGRSGCRSEGSG